EIFNVRNQQPARHIFNLADRSLDESGLKFAGYFDRLPKGKHKVADDNLVLITKPDRLVYTALVQESSITAAKINQPKLADVLHVDNGVPTRNLWRIQNHRVFGGSSDGAIARDLNAVPAGRMPAIICGLSLCTTVPR